MRHNQPGDTQHFLGLWHWAVGRHHTKLMVIRPRHVKDENQYLHVMLCRWGMHDSTKCHLCLNQEPSRCQRTIMVSEYRVGNGREMGERKVRGWGREVDQKR